MICFCSAAGRDEGQGPRDRPDAARVSSPGHPHPPQPLALAPPVPRRLRDLQPCSGPREGERLLDPLFRVYCIAPTAKTVFRFFNFGELLRANAG